jgi:hypothetical protein
VINSKEKKILSQLRNLESKLSEDYYIKESTQLSSLVSFFEKISTLYNNLFDNFVDVNTDNQNNAVEKSLVHNFIYSAHNYQLNFLNRFKIIAQKINQEIIPILNKAQKKFEKDIKKSVETIQDITGQISLHHDVLNMIKEEYFEECKKLEEIEKNSKNEKSNQENIQKMASQTKIMENKFYLYKKEVEVMKKLYSDSDKDYNNLKLKIKENDIKKNNAIYLSIVNYVQMILNDNKNIKEETETFDTKLSQCKSYLNNSQFTQELFSKTNNYNIEWKYDFNISLVNNEQQKDYKKDEKKEDETLNDEEENDKKKNDINSIEEIIMPKKKEEIEGIDIVYMELNKELLENVKKEDDKNLINDLSGISKFFKILRTKEIIQTSQKNDIVNTLEKHKKDIDYYLKFCDLYLESNESEIKNILEFQSFTNLAYFSNLLKSIIENISDNLLSNDINAYNLFDKIICIGEKSMYENTYMCSLLSSESPIFQKEIIWKNGIKNKLLYIYDGLCKKEFYSTTKESKTLKNLNAIKKGFGAFGKLFMMKGNSKEKIQEKNIIETYELDKNIKVYKQLEPLKIKNICNNYGQIVLHEIIKCYIRHMINYNYLNYKDDNDSHVQEIIFFILNDFSLIDMYNTKFFNLYYASSIYTIKKPQKIKKEKIRKNNPLGNALNGKEMNNIFIITNTSKYLDVKEKIQLMNLSKKYLDVNKYIFGQILRGDDNFNSKKRIGIWKILLGYKNSFQNCNYKTILDKISKTPFDEKNKSNYVIMMDIRRTKFKAMDNDGQTILCNLLRCLFEDDENKGKNENEKISYCQGMNFIAGLLYDIVQNEEETFHLLKSFILNDKYGIIFKNKLEILKVYFVILEKLIFLFLPKLYHKLKDNSIQIDYFASPYFVTLFTNVYFFHPENANKFLLHSLDNFILEGWSSVFSTVICILKYFEKKILNLNGEILVKFIINEICKSDLFIDSNYDIFQKLLKENWINDDLLKCIEEEIKTERKIKEEFNK